jgi:hypothetical protein
MFNNKKTMTKTIQKINNKNNTIIKFTIIKNSIKNTKND